MLTPNHNKNLIEGQVTLLSGIDPQKHEVLSSIPSTTNNNLIENWNCLNLIKVTHTKSTDNIIINGQQLKAFILKLRMK